MGLDSKNPIQESNDLCEGYADDIINGIDSLLQSPSNNSDMPFNTAQKNTLQNQQKLADDSDNSYDDQNEHVVYEVFNQLDLDKDESPHKQVPPIRNRQEIDF